MLRRDADQATKIRKRCALSSTSSGASQDPRRTTTRRRLRLKRSVRLVGRSGCGGASSPPCKIICSRRRKRMSESSWSRHHLRVETRPTSAASARKLVSALWQLNKGPGACEEEEGEVGWDAAATRRGSDHRRSASVEFSKLSRRKSRALEGDGERSWHNGHAHGHWFSDVMSNGGTMEAHACPQGLASPCPGDRTAQLQDLHNSLTASKELVRVLANVLAPGALNPTAASLLAALRSELDVARARARQLVREQRRRCSGDEADVVRAQLAEEMRAWKSRHREKAAAAARLVASELDAERRSRQRAERVSKKLGTALAAAEASLREARRELDRERKARERMEKVCDELAAGVGGVGELEEEEETVRREAAESAREELEREREMLLVADELREERVRMKLAEARIQFEEKNAVVDRLRQELEAYLGHRDKDIHELPATDEHHRAAADDDRLLQLVLASSEPVVDGIDRVAVHKINREDRDRNGSAGGDVDDGDDSDNGSDIELNMDGNSWSYSTAASNRETAAKNNNNAASRSSRHGSFSDRGTDDRRSQGLGDQEALEQQQQHWVDQGCSDDDDRTSTRDMDEDAERYEAIKNLREQMLAGHGFVFLSQGDDRDDHRRHGLVSQVAGMW